MRGGTMKHEAIIIIGFDWIKGNHGITSLRIIHWNEVLFETPAVAAVRGEQHSHHKRTKHESKCLVHPEHPAGTFVLFVSLQHLCNYERLHGGQRAQSLPGFHLGSLRGGRNTAFTLAAPTAHVVEEQSARMGK